LLTLDKKRNVLDDEAAFIEASRCLLCDKCLAENYCNGGVKIKNFIKAIQEKNLKESLATINEENPISVVSCLLCDGVCEAGCVLEKPIKIQKLEQFVNERGRTNLSQNNNLRKTFIAIVGGGACGFSAALTLAKAGANVTVYDKLKLRGGTFSNLNLTKINRLDTEKLLATAEAYSIKILNDVNVDSKKMIELESFYNYVILATGKSKSREFLNINNNYFLNARDVLEKINYSLKNENSLEYKMIGETVVIGDSFSAIEVAKAAIYLGSSKCTLVTSSKYKNKRDLAMFSNLGLSVFYDLKPTNIVKKNSLYTVTFDSGFTISANTIINGFLEKDYSFLNSSNIMLDENGIKTFYDCMTTNETVFAAGSLTKDIDEVMYQVAQGKYVAKCIIKDYKRKIKD